MKLTKTDKKMLLDWRHTERDLPQIEEAFKKRNTKYNLSDKPISREEAVALLGQRKYLAGIARSAFHFTATQVTTDGKVICFDSSNLFR